MTELTLRPLEPFGAEASGLDLRRPLDNLQVRAVETAMDAHAVLVWRDQPLDQHQQIASRCPRAARRRPAPDRIARTFD